MPFASVIPAILPAGTVDLAYSQMFPASGGLSPYTWSVTSGTLPAGISLNSTTGVLSGTPTGSGGSFSFTLNVTDSLGTSVSQATQVIINPLSFGVADGGEVSLKTQDTAATVQVGYGVVDPIPATSRRQTVWRSSDSARTISW